MAKLKNRKLRAAIVETCRQMNRLGINQGAVGNVSARLPGDGAGFLITPSGVPYDALAPEQIVPMDLDGAYDGDWLPSSEWRMHLDIHRSRADAGAVVHTHAIYGTALACLRMEIPAFHYMVAVAGGPSIRCAGYATFGTQALSDHILVALEDRKACLIANHGVVCLGPDLTKALALAVEVETLAKQYWVALQAGTPVILPDDEMARVLVRFRSYGRQPEASEVKTAGADTAADDDEDRDEA